jgi:hypothetical protein
MYVCKQLYAVPITKRLCFFDVWIEEPTVGVSSAELSFICMAVEKMQVCIVYQVREKRNTRAVLDDWNSQAMLGVDSPRRERLLTEQSLN